MNILSIFFANEFVSIFVCSKTSAYGELFDISKLD
jgi:hypothetical protein